MIRQRNYIVCIGALLVGLGGGLGGCGQNTPDDGGWFTLWDMIFAIILYLTIVVPILFLIGFLIYLALHRLGIVPSSPFEKKDG